MARRLAAIVLGSAAYGFAIGAMHSFWLAGWNVAKLPLLILLTGLICALAYYAFARFLTNRLTFGEVWDLSMSTYRDLSILLASLGPVSLFLSWTMEQPDTGALNEYPLILGLNVAFIALCGVVALVRQAVVLLRRHRVTLRRSVLITVGWLAISLFAGGQVCWFFRPYFGPRSMPDLLLVEGTREDYRGATSFYEAVYHLIDPPPLPDGYWTHR